MVVLPFFDHEGHLNDPLVWWKTHGPSFPTLSKLARILLAIPATSAPSERVFSKASLVINKLRAGMDPKNAGMVIFLKDYLTSERKKQKEEEQKRLAEDQKRMEEEQKRMDEKNNFDACRTVPLESH